MEQDIPQILSQLEKEMKGLSLQSRDHLTLRKSAIFKPGQRRVSCVTFGENKIIEIEKREDIIDKADKENDDQFKQIIADKMNDDNGVPEEDVPVVNNRRWTDSLKIRRKKKKDVKVVDNEKVDVEGNINGEQSDRNGRKEKTA